MARKSRRANVVQEKKEELRKDKWKTKQTSNRIFRQTK